MGLRLSVKEAKALGIEIPARPAKFHNKPGRLDGIHFDSDLELKRYAYLVWVEMANELTDLIVHPKFDLFAAGPLGPVLVGTYEGDFSYIDRLGIQVVEDCKGVVLPLYVLKRNLFSANYPSIKFMEVRQCRKRWTSREIKGSHATT